MTKRLFVAAVAVFVWMPHASGQSILQRSDWQARSFETYLPSPGPAVPWLDLNPKTKLPKGDLPFGRGAASVGHFVLPSGSVDTQMSSNADGASRSM